MPGTVFGFGYASNNDEIYAFGGAVGRAYTPALYAYNTNIEDWYKVPFKNFPSVNFTSMLYLKKHRGILVAGGIQRYGTVLTLTEDIRIIYDEQFRIRILGPVPEPAKGLALAQYDEKVYMLGGSKSMEVSRLQTRRYTFSDKMFSYDLETGALDTLPAMPVAMETVSAAVDGKLYTFGGFNGSSRADVWQYDINQRSWTALEPLEEATSAHALVQYKHYVILVGDYYNSERLIVYDTKSKSATYFKTNTGGRFPGAAILDDYLHVYGGSNNMMGHYRIALDQIIPKADQ